MNRPSKQQRNTTYTRVLDGITMNNFNKNKEQINWQKNIGSSLQISILYDGRSSSGAKIIHAGSMQARAFF